MQETKEKMYLNAREIAELTGLKSWRCYQLIKDCNKQLEKEGKYTMRNVVSRKALLKFINEV